MKHTEILFGKESVSLPLNPDIAEWTVLKPDFEKPLSDPRAEFIKAVSEPVGARPLSEAASPEDRVVIATSDGTRPVPNRILIPWILEQLDVPDDQVTVLIGTGTHRGNSPEEIERMFGPELMNRIHIENHNAYEPECNIPVGRTKTGYEAHFNRKYTEADVKIILGFIEPHFFAGFSGGAKAVVPGVASIETVLHIHRADLLGHPDSTWGIADGNPLRTEIEEMVSLCPPDFMVNVTLNCDKEITGFYCGDYISAHRPGCAHVRQNAMKAVDTAFPIVITSNSGFPLDQNLYQSVKGISAASRITAEGGTIFLVSECSDGVPEGGYFEQIMQKGETPREILDWIFSQDPTVLDQWQAQCLAGILKNAEVRALTKMSHDDLEKCKIKPVLNLEQELLDCIHGLGSRPKIAVLPEGPLTIPYVSE